MMIRLIEKLGKFYSIISCITLICFINQVRLHKEEQITKPAPVVVDDKTVYKILIPNLPPKHYQFWLKNHPRAYEEFKSICLSTNTINNLETFQALHTNLTFEDENYLIDLKHGRQILNEICSKIKDVQKSCWGYETNCQIIHLMPECRGSSLGEAKNEQEQKITWFGQADFGYILEQRKELAKYCSPDKQMNHSIKSSLECTKNFKTCRADNLLIKFDNLPNNRESLITMKEPYKSSLVGGWNCDLQVKRIQEENGQRGQLQSWFNELEAYTKLDTLLTSDQELSCDVTIEKPAFILKLDHPSNMYHYFCNFLNLYATIHLNNRFSEDNQIIIWDNQLPRSKFESMWSVFSKNQYMSIDQFAEKRVCFKKAIFTLLPRMLNGLYYNTPLIAGCSKSGLFDAFNKHVLHKMKIRQDLDQQSHKAHGELIRLTIISRRTQHRVMENEKELELMIRKKSKDFQVTLIDYSELDFKTQLQISQNTDVLIGLHGSGLTHLLFQPEWAAVIELYDCQDKSYYDLSRLRGIDYYTSTNAKMSLAKKVPVQDEQVLKDLRIKKLVDHDKFSNYVINLEEASSVLDKAIEKVRSKRAKYFKDLGQETPVEQINPGPDKKVQNLKRRHEEL